MDFILATSNYGFRCPVFGEGYLEKGKIYYSYSKFAKDVSLQDAGNIMDLEPPDTFTGRLLKDGLDGARVLLIHSGGFGDTVSLGILLRLIKNKWGLKFDVCCHQEKFKEILVPMGFDGKCLSYPPEASTLNRYDYVLPELSKMVADQKALVDNSVVELLCRSFGITDYSHDVQYVIDGHAMKRMKLPSTNRIRVGINFDSDSPLKSYPESLQPVLVQTLARLGGELYFMGKKPIERSVGREDRHIHDYTAGTSIPELAALLDQMDFVLAVDSFAANLSGILGKSTLVLMSTTGEGLFSHFKNVSGFGGKIECRPCGSVLSKSRCPLGYSECKAFHHPSIRPDIIVKKVIDKLTTSFKERI